MLLYDYAHFEVHFVDRGGDTLLITFNEMRQKADGRRFWAASLLEKLGLSAIGFVSREPNWFPAQETRGAISRVNDFLGQRFPRRICYGMSQGAYATLRYQRDCGAEMTLAFSPQASIDPTVVEDARFNRFFQQDLHTDMLPESSDSTVRRLVFYDPKDICDKRHVALLKTQFSIMEFALPYIGHSSAIPFAHTETMRRVLQLTTQEDWVGLRNICREVRRRSPSRAYAICHTTSGKWPGITLRIFAKYRNIYPLNSWWLIGRLLAMKGLGQQVIGWMCELCEKHPNKSEVLACTAVVAVEIKNKILAQSYIQKALDLDPNNSVWLWVSRTADALPDGNEAASPAPVTAGPGREQPVPTGQRYASTIEGTLSGLNMPDAANGDQTRVGLIPTSLEPDRCQNPPPATRERDALGRVRAIGQESKLGQLDIITEPGTTTEAVPAEEPLESGLAWMQQPESGLSSRPAAERRALRVAAIMHLIHTPPKTAMAVSAFSTLPMPDLRAIFRACAETQNGLTPAKVIKALEALTGEEAAIARRRGFYAALSAYPKDYWITHLYVRNLRARGMQPFAIACVWSRYPAAVSANALLLSALPDDTARSRFIAPNLASPTFRLNVEKSQGWGAIVLAKHLHQEHHSQTARLMLRKIAAEGSNVALRFAALTALAHIASPDPPGQLVRLRCLLTAVFISPNHVSVTSILRESDTLLNTVFPTFRRTGDRFDFASGHFDILRSDGAIDFANTVLQSLVMPEILSPPEMQAFRDLSSPAAPIPCILQPACFQSIPPIVDSPNPPSSTRFSKLFATGGEVVAAKITVTKFNLKDIILVSGARHTTYFSNNGSGTALLGPSEGHSRFLHRTRYESVSPNPLDEPCISLILALSGGNYCHFLLDNASRISTLSTDEMQRTVLATPHTAKWTREILAMAGSHQRVQEIEPETPYRVREVMSFNSTQHPMNCGDHDYVGFYRALSRNCPAHDAKYIYIQRPQNRRGLENEEEIHALLRKYGYLFVKMEDFDLASQAGLMARAEVILGVHGAGLSNIVFCQQPRILVELIPRNYFTPAFRILAAAVGAQYIPFLEDISRRTGSETQYTDLFIEVDRLEPLLAKISNQP